MEEIIIEEMDGTYACYKYSSALSGAMRRRAFTVDEKQSRAFYYQNNLPWKLRRVASKNLHCILVTEPGLQARRFRPVWTDLAAHGVETYRFPFEEDSYYLFFRKEYHDRVMQILEESG